MTWTDLTPHPSSGGGTRLGAVMLSATRFDGRFKPYLVITIRPALFGAMPDWLKLGARVGVQRGEGSDGGMLRIVPGLAFVVGRYPKSDALRIAVPPLPAQRKAKQASVACEFDWQDKWITIDLPGWAKAGAAVPQPALSPEAQKRAGRPL